MCRSATTPPRTAYGGSMASGRSSTPKTPYRSETGLRPLAALPANDDTPPVGDVGDVSEKTYPTHQPLNDILLWMAKGACAREGGRWEKPLTSPTTLTARPAAESDHPP